MKTRQTQLYGYPPPPQPVTNEMIAAWLDELTHQEHKVLRLLLQELSCKEMAEKLSISVQTVEKHRKNMLRKSNLNGKVALRKVLRQVERYLLEQKIPET